MKVHFSPAEQKIMNILRDGKWHCLVKELEGEMIDYRARITQKGAIKDKLEKHGYTVETKPCNLHHHKSNILMRRIVKLRSLWEINMKSGVEQQQTYQRMFENYWNKLPA